MGQMSFDLDGVICKLLLNPVHNSAAVNAVRHESRTNSLTRLSRLQSYEATLPPKTAATPAANHLNNIEPPNVLVRTRPSSGGHSTKGTRGSPSRPVDPASEELTESEVRALVVESRKLFMSQPMLVELHSPVKVCGDIHGQYHDLLRLFDLAGYPPATNYLFLGDYVDRGDQSLETVCLLLAYKLRFPDNFFVLRGNHESSSINRIYGFFDECKRRYSVAVWKLFTDTFNCLPVAALVEERVLCMHGGLSPELDSLDQLRRILRPTDVPDSGLICDLLWSDPGEPGQQGWGENDRGVSWTFGEDVVEQVVAKFDIDLVCRAHQVVDEGYQFYSARRLLTVFSAPNYCGEFNNAGAFLTVDEQLHCSVTQILPTYDVNVFC